MHAGSRSSRAARAKQGEPEPEPEPEPETEPKKPVLMSVTTSVEILTMTKCLVNGELVEAPASFDVTNPSTGEVFARAPHADAAMTEAAIEAAKAAFPGWAATPIEVRRAKVSEALSILKAHEGELAELLVKEQGKPLEMALGECGMCWEQMQKIIDTELPVELYSEDEDFKTVAVRKPIGPVAGITPWNFPMFCSIQKWTPSICWGNTFIHKPSPYTPLTGARIAELLKDVFPPGVFNYVAGSDKEGHNVGITLVNSPSVRKVSFTGSVATGKAIMAASANDMKRITLELGGNDPAIIRADCDPKIVAPEVFSGAFSNTGQICCAIKRAFVHESIYDEFVAEIKKSAESAVMGDGFKEGVEFGPLNNEMQFNKVKSIVDEARESGATIVTGGKVMPNAGKGYFYEPTIISDVKEGARIVDEEQFGPVLPIIKYSDDEEALARANSTELGLGGSVWSQDVAAANGKDTHQHEITKDCTTLDAQSESNTYCRRCQRSRIASSRARSG